MALFERRGRGLVPTDAGHMLARYVKRQQDIQDSFFSEIDSLRKAERGHIDLVLGEGFVEMMFDRVLPGYWRSHPEVTLDIDVARTSEIAQRIIDDQAYIGLVFQPPNDARLRTHYSRPEPIRAIVRDDHPLTRLRRPLLLTDLADYPGAAMQEGFGVRQHIQAAEISEQVRLRNVLTTSSFKALWQFAATGIGYALTPPIAVTADLRAQLSQPAAVQSDPEPGQPAGAEPGRPPCVPGRAGAAGPYRARHCPAGRRDICYARLSRSCACHAAPRRPTLPGRHHDRSRACGLSCARSRPCCGVSRNTPPARLRCRHRGQQARPRHRDGAVDGGRAGDAAGGGRPLGGARGAVKSGGQPVRDPRCKPRLEPAPAATAAVPARARSYAYRPHDLITRMT